jgi:hypothetical protein
MSLTATAHIIPSAIDDTTVTYPPVYDHLPTPLPLPFALKPVHSADTGIEALPDGRTRYWIRHDIVRGVSPAMIAWWFAHIEGTVEFAGRRYNRYRFWHPGDHVHGSVHKRRPDGTVGPGASLRLIEVLGRNPKFLVDTITHIERLDEGGYIHNPEMHGRTGFVRMEYRFEAVPTGTFYENSLIIGAAKPWYRLVKPLVARFGFTPEQGRAWLRHNVEEVGMFENFLPGLYRAETGRTC